MGQESVAGGDNLSYLNAQGPLKPIVVRSQRGPSTNDRRYKIGTIWIDEVAMQAFILASVSQGAPDWIPLGSSTSMGINQLTGDTGGSVTPVSGNVNVLGGALYSTSASGQTLTVNPSQNGYPATPYVVGPVGIGGYQTIQAAIDAINLAGTNETIYVTPGVYTENLTFTGPVQIVGSAPHGGSRTVVIIGTHTPPTSGSIGFGHLELQSASDIFNTSASGTGTMFLNGCAANITGTGYLFNMPNWTGALVNIDVGSVPGGVNGIVNNSAGAPVFIFNGNLGAAGISMEVSGTCFLNNCLIGCPINFNGSSIINAYGG
jgi:hypothetical protein